MKIFVVLSALLASAHASEAWIWCGNTCPKDVGTKDDCQAAIDSIVSSAYAKPYEALEELHFEPCARILTLSRMWTATTMGSGDQCGNPAAAVSTTTHPQ